VTPAENKGGCILHGFKPEP